VRRRLMKKIIGFVVGTVMLVGVAIGVQAFATSGEEAKGPPAVSDTTTQSPPDGTTESPSDGSGAGSTDEKTDDGEREGFTEDHTGKPGESK
jgi:hypothetical protein